MTRTIEALGRIDIFVSNPAFSRRADFLEFDPETFARVIEGTLTGGFHMGQLVARHMVARGGGGKIVFISSCHVKTPYARSVAYNAAKAGLNNMAFTIATELYRHRINVNVIEPGWIDTPGEHESFGSQAIEQAGPTLPWGRLGTPEDIGKAAVFLASDDADYITGTALAVDGGIWLRSRPGSELPESLPKISITPFINQGQCIHRQHRLRPQFDRAPSWGGNRPSHRRRAGCCLGFGVRRTSSLCATWGRTHLAASWPTRARGDGPLETVDRAEAGWPEVTPVDDTKQAASLAPARRIAPSAAKEIPPGVRVGSLLRPR